MKLFITFIAALCLTIHTHSFVTSRKHFHRFSICLDSHLSSLQTTLTDKETLMKALDDIGVEAISDRQELEIRGANGKEKLVKVDIVIHQSNNYDVAFSFNGKTYELVADLQFWEQSMPVAVFLDKVNQRYAIHSITDTAGKDGFEVEKVTTSVDGTVTLKMSRYAFK